MVINTDNHDEKRTHWLAVYIQDKKNIDFFYSPPEAYGACLLSSEAYGEDPSRFVEKYNKIQ